MMKKLDTLGHSMLDGGTKDSGSKGLFSLDDREDKPNLGIFGDNYTVPKKVDKQLYQGLGPANNPFQSIIQAMAFRNPDAKNLFGDFGKTKESVLPFGLGDLEQPEMYPDESNALRAFIWEIMNAKR